MALYLEWSLDLLRDIINNVISFGPRCLTRAVALKEECTDGVMVYWGPRLCVGPG